MIAIEIRTKHDVNGNSRRMCVVLDEDGNVVRAVDTGCEGRGALERAFPTVGRSKGTTLISSPRVALEINVSPTEFKRIKKDAEKPLKKGGDV